MSSIRQSECNQWKTAPLHHNLVDDEVNLAIFRHPFEVSIIQDDMQLIGKIDPSVLKWSSHKMKLWKSDLVMNITSYFIMQAPCRVFQLLLACLESDIWYMHTDFLFMSKLIAIIILFKLLHFALHFNDILALGYDGPAPGIAIKWYPQPHGKSTCDIPAGKVLREVMHHPFPGMGLVQDQFE